MKSARSFVAYLRKHGYQELGSGLYSVVYGKPGVDKVIKIGGHQGGGMDEYLHYIMWAISRGYAGKQAPKVYSFKLYRDERGGYYYVVILERLSSDYDSYLRHQITDGTGHFRYDEKNIPAEWQEFAKEFTEEFPHANDMHEGNWMGRNGELVLTDPLGGSGCGSSLPKRFKSPRPVKADDARAVWC